MTQNNIPLPTLFKYLHRDYMAEQEKNRQLHVQLGQEKAYSQELENKVHKLEKIIDERRTEGKELLREVKREQAYDRMRKELSRLRESIKSAYIARDNAISKAVACQHELDELKNNIKNKIRL